MPFTMNSSIQLYNNIVAKVTFLIKQLKIKVTKSTGRTFAITPENTISLALFKQLQGIETKKSIWEIFEPECSYKTLNYETPPPNLFSCTPNNRNRVRSKQK